MGTIKTCDRCGKIIDNKEAYLSWWFESTSEDKGTNGDISDGFDLCQECYDDFKHSYLKYFEMVSLEEAKKDEENSRRGKWLTKQESNDAEPIILFKCSRCNKDLGMTRPIVNGKIVYNYCPNCRAKMEV